MERADEKENERNACLYLLIRVPKRGPNWDNPFYGDTYTRWVGSIRSGLSPLFEGRSLSSCIAFLSGVFLCVCARQLYSLYSTEFAEF